jgi:hypothetical protein
MASLKSNQSSVVALYSNDSNNNLSECCENSNKKADGCCGGSNCESNRDEKSAKNMSVNQLVDTSLLLPVNDTESKQEKTDFTNKNLNLF